MAELANEVRSYRPEAVLIAEQYQNYPETIQARDQGGMGYGFRTHYPFFVKAVRPFAQKRDEEIDMLPLDIHIRGIWENAAQLHFITNHDVAANPEKGAAGAYFATLVDGGGWDHVEGKTKAWGALALLAGSAYIDMPQFRLLQQGDMNVHPWVDWSLLQLDSQRGVNGFFTQLSFAVQSRPAFAFVNHHPEIKNHIDLKNKVISLERIDFVTGRRYYAVINLSSRALDDYTFGIPIEGGKKTKFSIVIDSDRGEFLGTGTLASRIPEGVLQLNGWGEGEKPNSISIPHLGPYGVVLLEQK
jgi:hypothetical protein